MASGHQQHAADALIAEEELVKRRAEQAPPYSPLLPGTVACPYDKSRACSCGGRGFCLDVA
jgi:hypothetical protein